MSYSIELDGQIIPVKLRWNKQAKRLILRLNQKEDGVIVTLPHGIREKEGLEMAMRHKVWIANQFSKQVERVSFQDGAHILLRGETVTLKHMPNERGTVWVDDNNICIAGDEKFLHRRLTDWLKKQAKADITPLAHEMAATLEKKVKRISVKDTVSRWGSCSAQGNLSFNWRLIFAPPEILKYVVAHEVSHLKHMDHSKSFWDTVDLFDVDAKYARHWLKKNGTRLQKLGQ